MDLGKMLAEAIERQMREEEYKQAMAAVLSLLILESGKDKLTFDINQFKAVETGCLSIVRNGDSFEFRHIPNAQESAQAVREANHAQKH